MSTFTPPWGTVQTDPDHPGLSTGEAVNNLMMAFNRMRPITVSENSTTTEVQADASLILTGGVTSLTLGQGAYKGVELKISHDATNVTAQILNGAKIITARKGDYLDLRWNGTEWRVKTNKLVGDIIVQHPSELSPEDRCLEGTWAQWSYRASLYAIGDTAPSDAFIADWKTYRHDVWGLNTDNTYITNEDVGTKKYTKPTGYTCVERQELQPDWTEEDLVEGAQITDGPHAGKYIWQVIAFAGTFFGVEDSGYEGGGKRPTFGSGVQGDRIREMTGTAGSAGRLGASQFASGVFKARESSASSAGNNVGGVYTLNDFRAGNIVRTGEDVAPTNTSIRIWRRVPDPV
jgi:hypothetical protein